MSGHSKWATIHRQKEVSDQKRGQVFTKISNAIIIAVRESGGITDPDHNFKLRLIMEKARAANMPKDNIQRAIDRASGKGEGDNFTEITYEGYGPAGVGIIIETTTDNKQRTVQEIKNIFDKAGGNVASPGSVAFNFEKKGLLTIESKKDKDELILKLIDLGAEDVEEGGDDLLEVYVNPEELMLLKEKLAGEGIEPKTTEITMRPINLVSVNDEKTTKQIIALMEKLESLDDVQKVYSNFDVPEEMLQNLQ